jgi:hypothetical protein
LKNSKKCPFICFASDDKIIPCTFGIRGILVFLCPKEREREKERGGRVRGEQEGEDKEEEEEKEKERQRKK